MTGIPPNERGHKDYKDDYSDERARVRRSTGTFQEVRVLPRESPGLRGLVAAARGMDEDRSRWDRKAELVLCCLGVTMGVGNVWRFPKAVYEGGGGTFLLPYLVASLLLAKPLLCLEMCLGQFAGAGVLAVFQCCPLSRGLGASLCVQAAGSALLGNVVLAYTLLYLYHSWSIPWETCSADWGADMTTCFVADGRMSPATSSSSAPYATLSPATTGSTTDCRNGTELATYQYW
ncbi:hypothetical protein HPB47_001021 [Ixodes persulcatus]|uniref:Uncharacterized protein n=1 Tax=Ixodes persulcatus TaxID=34615 RepID=A0AC60PQ78_IXOPE|nr:hypothetical protein HPB47_001021 [Ixodes persulcatus]